MRIPQELKPLWQYSFEEVVAMMEGNYWDNYRRYEQYTEDRCSLNDAEAILDSILESWSDDNLNIILVILSRGDIYGLYSIYENGFVYYETHISVKRYQIFGDTIYAIVESVRNMNAASVLKWSHSFVESIQDLYAFDHEAHRDMCYDQQHDVACFHLNLMIESLLVSYALDRWNIVTRDISNIKSFPFIWEIENDVRYYLDLLENDKIDGLPISWQATISQVRNASHLFKDYDGVKFTINSLIDAGVYPAVRWLNLYRPCDLPIEDVIKYEFEDIKMKAATYVDFMSSSGVEVGIVLKPQAIKRSFNCDVYSYYNNGELLQSNNYHYSGYHELFVEIQNNVERIVVSNHMNPNDMEKVREIAHINNIPVEIVEIFGAPHFCRKYITGGK